MDDHRRPLDSNAGEEVDASVVDADAAVRAGGPERIAQAGSVAAVDADLAWATVEAVECVGVGGEKEHPGAVEGVRVGLADSFADCEQAGGGGGAGSADDGSEDADR